MRHLSRMTLLLLWLALIPIGLLVTAGHGDNALVRQSTLQPLEVTASYIVAGATGTQVALIGPAAATATAVSVISATNAAAASIVRDSTATGASIERGDFLTPLRETQAQWNAELTAAARTGTAYASNLMATEAALNPNDRTATAAAPYTAVAATWTAFQPIVTAYWQGATATAQAMPTFYLTATADYQTAVVLEQSHNLTLTAFPIDPLLATATYILAGATETQAAYMTNTAVAGFGLPTPQPQLPTYLATPVVPISPQEIESHRNEYLGDLISATGFKHPIFDGIIANILENNAKSGRWEDGHSIHVVQTQAEGAKYLGLIVQLDSSWLWSDRLFMFQISNNAPILLQNPLAHVDGLGLGFYGRIVDNWNENDPAWIDKYIFVHGFYDWNHNGLPDLAISSDSAGNCCSSPQLHLIEIKTDGTIEDISPSNVDVVPYGFVDPDHDGQWEIIGISRRGGAGPEYYHWFGWDGTTYVDTSADHADFYQPQIDAFKQKLETNLQCHDPRSYELESILYSYKAMGRLKEGWAEIETLLNWDTCTADHLKQFGGNMAYIERWVKEHTS